MAPVAKQTRQNGPVLPVVAPCDRNSRACAAEFCKWLLSIRYDHPLAEGGGFEPPVQVYPVQRFSKPPPSAARPSLRREIGTIQHGVCGCPSRGWLLRGQTCSTARAPPPAIGTKWGLAPDWHPAGLWTAHCRVDRVGRGGVGVGEQMSVHRAREGRCAVPEPAAVRQHVQAGRRSAPMHACAAARGT